MHWIDIVWPMIGATSLTIGFIHLLIWIQPRANLENFIFSLVALLVAMMSVLELLGMRAVSAAGYGDLLRWGQCLYAGAIVLLVVFIDLRFRAGSKWLFHASWLSRAAALVANLFTGVNLNFASIHSLVPVVVLGDTISMPVGDGNRWMVLGQFATIMLLAYLVSVILELRRRQDPAQARRALTVCGSVMVFLLSSNVAIILVVLGVARAPIMVSLTFLVVVLAISYELAGDVIRAGLLSRKLNDSQRSLGESEGRLQLAAKAGGLGLWTWDVDGDGPWFSPTGYRLLQLAPGEAIDWDGLLAQAHPEDRQALRAARLTARQTGAFDCDFRLQQPDGGERWLAANGKLDTENGNGARVVRGVLVDVSARKLAERQREELAHLSRVALVNEMASTLAHELSQPLTAVLSNAQAAERFLAKDPPDLPEVRDCLADIIDNDRRASEVISRVRAMMRKDAVNHERMDVNQVVREALLLVAGDLQQRDVTVALKLAPVLPPVMGDPVQIKQVLVNLMTNAAHALEEITAGRTITVGTRRSSATRVEITISDNGAGILPDQLERVFTAFVTSKTTGLGLGLPICRNIAQSHGGMLSASNVPDGGACFHLVLPAAECGDEE